MKPFSFFLLSRETAPMDIFSSKCASGNAQFEHAFPDVDV